MEIISEASAVVCYPGPSGTGIMRGKCAPDVRYLRYTMFGKYILYSNGALYCSMVFVVYIVVVHPI